MSYKRSRSDFEADKSSRQHQHSQAPYVVYGTGLPPLDSNTRDDGSYVPVWKQEVRDERGRKRLHGAFTGGFSAGYFNTVGSKEGWTPSTFVSSRSDRRKNDDAPNQQKVEDFMDEEDVADLQESQHLQTQSHFAGLGAQQDDSARPGFMSDLFRPSGDTMGIKLLQRMGWRPGQGLGPKVRRKAMGDDGEAEHLFAPDDVPMIAFRRKTDRFGIGWSGEQRLDSGSRSSSRPTAVPADDSDDDESSFVVRKPTKKPSKVKKTGFGVGVLNDTGSDDEDAYEIGPKISYNKIIGGDKKKRKGGLVANTGISKNVSSPVFLSQKLTSRTSSNDLRRCHDGRLPLDGFVLAMQALTMNAASKYPPPAVPEGWKPSKLNMDTSSTSTTFQSASDAAKASTLDPAERASMLGEARLPGKSIFDFISSAARNKLADATGANLPQGKGESAPAGFEQTPAERQKSTWDLVPRLDRAVAQAALTRGASGWMPYAEDDEKRARYRSFLESMTGQRQELPVRAPKASTDDWVTEMREFAQAAMVFKPVSGLMASRFTSAKASGEGPKKASDAVDSKFASASKDESKPSDPAEQAARLGMFGPMTRSVQDFFPTRLTCKRFGVKPPAHVLHGPDAGEGSSKAKYDVVGKSAMDQMMREAAFRPAYASDSTDPVVPAPVPDEPAVVDAERNDALEGQRAGEELFKAIFGGDSDDE